MGYFIIIKFYNIFSFAFLRFKTLSALSAAELIDSSKVLDIFFTTISSPGISILSSAHLLIPSELFSTLVKTKTSII